MTPKIVFFGASELARPVVQDWPADLPIAYVVDNDSEKWGRTFEGLPIKSPEVLNTEPFGGVFVVVTSRWSKEIAQQLGVMGFSAGLDFSLPDEAEALLRQSVEPRRAFEATVAVFEDHWFGVDYVRLRELLVHSSIRTVAARVPAETARVAIELDTLTYRTLRVQGVPLFDACVFDICVACGTTPDKLDAAHAEHWPAIVEHMRCAAAAVSVVGRWLDWQQPDAIVIPQGHLTICAVYRYLAVLRGIRVIALENSLNSARLVWDDVAGIAVNKIPARNYYWRWVDLVDAQEAHRHVDAYIASVKHAKTADHQSPDACCLEIPAERPVVLYLANVLNDSSVVFNSRVGSQVDAIKAVARWAIEHECTFVLKLHPRERPGSEPMRRTFPPSDFCYEGLTIRALQEDRSFWDVVSGSDRCLIDADNRFDTYDLIRRSDACVTVCSQAGLEALLLGKETVVLGDAYYGGLGFTHDVHDVEQVGSALQAALHHMRRRVDAHKIAKFFYIFDRLYCIEKSTEGVAGLIERSLGRRRPVALGATA